MAREERRVQELDSMVMVNIVFEQSGAPCPARGLIILFTGFPELIVSLNCAGHDRNGFGPPFS